MLRLIHMEQNQNVLDTPVTPLPNPGEGGPVYSGDDDSQIPAIPLPNPGEGGPVYSGDDDNAQILLGLGFEKMLAAPTQQAAARWPRQCSAIRTCLDRLARYEAEDRKSVV